MSAFLAAVEELLADARRVEALLALEKRRRGVGPGRLVFIGASNVAAVRWCPQKAVLKSRAEELSFFAASLCDRLVYAHLLGLLPELPATDRGLLEAGGEVGLAEVEGLLRRMPPPNPAPWAYREVEGPDGVAWLLNPALTEAERARVEMLAAAAGVRLMAMEEEPKLRGPSVTCPRRLLQRLVRRFVHLSEAIRARTQGRPRRKSRARVIARAKQGSPRWTAHLY
jgi:hypothetical protein